MTYNAGFRSVAEASTVRVLHKIHEAGDRLLAGDRVLFLKHGTLKGHLQGRTRPYPSAMTITFPTMHTMMKGSKKR